MTTNNRQHDVAQVLRLPLPERPYDIRCAFRFALISLAVSLALIVAAAAMFRSTRELAGAFLPGLTWW